ncbi:hypothetical protein VTO73DRAFT_10852 [Trametes versicolor]
MCKKRPPGYVPKPPNNFMLFRSDTVKELTARDAQLGLPLPARQHYSKPVAALWRIAKKKHPEVVAKYTARAKQARAAHKLKYPEYWQARAQKKSQQRAPKRAHAPSPPLAQGMDTVAGQATTSRPHGYNSPGSLPDLLPSTAMTSAETTPGPSTPYAAYGHSPSEGPVYQQQASAQGQPYGPSVAEQYQYAMLRYTHQQMLAQDRAFDGQNTAGFSMGPAPRQRTGRAEDVRGQPYAHAAASRRLIQQQPQRLQGSMQSTGNRYAAPQAPADQGYATPQTLADQHYAAPEPIAYGPPAQAVQQRMTMQRPPQAPQPLQMDAEFAQPGAGFYHSAEANAAPTYRRQRPVQPPLGRVDGNHYGFLPDSAFLPMQANPSRSSSWGPARPPASVAYHFEQQRNMEPPSFNGPLQRRNDLYGLELYESPMDGAFTNSSYGPRAMEPSVWNATGAVTDTARDSVGWGYAESFPSAAPPSLPNSSGAFQQSSYVPTNMDYDPAVDDQYALGQGYYEAQAPNATQQLSSTDEFPFSGTYDYLGTPPQDTIYREGVSADKSMDALFDWALEYTMDS